MTRTLNVDRMRRHRHGTNRDVLALSDHILHNGDPGAYLDEWGARMEVKHGHRINGRTWRDKDAGVTYIEVCPAEGCSLCDAFERNERQERWS